MSDLESLLQYYDPLASIGSPSDTFKVSIDIRNDYSDGKILGEFVCFHTNEKENNIYSLGQITEVKTVNKWHEEPSFKSVIKRHGRLPHLSDDADNREATLNIQSSFMKSKDNTIAAQLSNSPATGTDVHPVNETFMLSLLEPITRNFKTKVLGKAYGSNVNIPFWFKHFGKGKNGAGDAYHIGVFGKTGSGKTTTAAQMLIGYAANSSLMNFLVFDPQDQFYNDNEILPNERSFKQEILKSGITQDKYKKMRLTKDFSLPESPELFAEILLSSGFIRRYFLITTEEKQRDMKEAIVEYINGRYRKTKNFLVSFDSHSFLTQLTKRMVTLNPDEKKEKADYTKYINSVYTQNNRKDSLVRTLNKNLSYISDTNNVNGKKFLDQFSDILGLFRTAEDTESLDTIIDDMLTGTGHFNIISLGQSSNKQLKNDNVQALVVDIIMSKIIDKSENMASEGSKANCLIVMDEAHRYVNSSTSEQRLKELNKKIVDSVRTVRKYGIGHMFITQTIDSIDQEVIQQMRTYAFGYGLTMGSEFNKIKQIINDDNAAKFYRSFIDPSSNGKYPFMFHGPISPLSFTGSPLFIEMCDGSDAESTEPTDSQFVSSQLENDLNDDVPF